MYINVLTFEAWEQQQNPDELKQWGNLKKEGSGEMGYNEAPYKKCPENIRKMFYSHYFNKLLEQQFVTA